MASLPTYKILALGMSDDGNCSDSCGEGNCTMTTRQECQPIVIRPPLPVTQKASYTKSQASNRSVCALTSSLSLTLWHRQELPQRLPLAA